MVHPTSPLNFEFCIRPLLILSFVDKVNVLSTLKMQERQSKDSLEILCISNVLAYNIRFLSTLSSFSNDRSTAQPNLISFETGTDFPFKISISSVKNH